MLEGSTHLADYSYDLAGRLVQTALGNGVTTSAGYDLSGQMTSLSHQKGSTQYAAYAYQYNAVGNRTQAQETIYYPHFNFLPLIFDPIEVIQVDPPGAPPDEYPGPGEDSFWLPGGEEIDPSSSENPYPEPGAVSSAEETSFLQKAWDFIVSLFTPEVRTASAHSAYSVAAMDGGLSSSTVTIDYGYDALNRLTSAGYSVGDDFYYTYDRVGNRSSQSIGGATTSYQYNAADRLISAGGVSYSWDANGNLLNDGVYTYSYDFADRLASVSGQGSNWSFGYDGLDNRYQQTLNGKVITYNLDLAGDLSQVLYDGATAYTYGLGRISQQRNGVSEYFLSDALGSVRQLADQNGSVSYGQAFDSFGDLIGRSGRGGSSYGYAGEWTDSSGLQHLRARYYSPGQGRFLTKDPFPGLLTQPASLTAYVYALNNPIEFTDPSGEFVETLFDVASLGYDIYTIGDKLSRGCALGWSDWVALGLDALSLAIPFFPAIGGTILRTGMHWDDAWEGIRAIKDFNEYFTDAALFSNRFDNADLVYRVMRTEQHPSSLWKGIFAKDISKNYTPQYHVTHGNRKATNWISTTRDLNWAKSFPSVGNGPIYIIDLNKVTNIIVDTTKPGVMNGWHFMAEDLARRASEVLIDKHIPPEAIIGFISRSVR